MPEPVTIILSLLGISVVGLAFTALRLIKNVTQFVAISLLIFFAILLANRSLNPRFDDLAIFSPDRQPGVQTDRPSISPRDVQDYRRLGQDLVARFSKNVGNFSDSLDAFVYGPQAKIGWQTLPEKLAAEELKRIPSQTSQRSVIAPGSRQTVTSTPRPTSADRPISAWW
ncbi:MAG: hypothetical protein KME11_13380 [Timaviella obliquedivisa GSE-PSE-MK23-08B]|jgi:hypothetical protein|nr:hypothetical protein [Timaviella obliquedivisa GSE-PSE-MK23-08B]